ncbi:uncharacterized protein [Montipora foliosa]|uniref:uncharacterized protein n=1 Tax=Montipora foliosa TaxID=591990 RepID=UPI0035F1F78A
MATLGTIESFNPSLEDWNAYSERFDQYVIANDIKDEKKIVATFLTTIGSKTYNALRDLLAPAKPSEVKFEELLKTLRDHYEPKPIVIAERFHFHKREQHEGKELQIERAHCQDVQKEGSNRAYRAELEEQSVRYVETGDQTPSNQDDEFKLFQISQEKPEPFIMLPVKVNGEDCSMELDTGASVSIMSEEAWKKRFPKAPLEKSTLKLRTYTGEGLDIIGQAHVQVAYQDQTANLPLQIIKGKGPSLFGRNWLRDIKLNWGSIKRISCNLDNVLTKHKSVFNDELGTMQGTKARLFVKSG